MFSPIILFFQTEMHQNQDSGKENYLSWHSETAVGFGVPEIKHRTGSWLHKLLVVSTWADY